MPEDDYRGYEGLQPFLDITRQGLGDLVDGHHWFDTVADDAVFDYLYEFPGYP